MQPSDSKKIYEVLSNKLTLNSRLITVDELCQHVRPGWGSLLRSLVVDLLVMGWDGSIVQVKEKFGGLRFYINVVESDIFDKVHKRIGKAEKESEKTCEICGTRGKQVTIRYYIQTLCKKHELEAIKAAEEEERKR